MPAPLDSLRRQRALIAEHLSWLDREIAAAEASSAPPQDGALLAPQIAPAPLGLAPVQPPPQFDALAAPVAPSPDAPSSEAAQPVHTPAAVAVDPAAVAEANARADAILASYSAQDRFDPGAARRSCLFMMLGAFAVFGAIFLVVYWVRYR
jgi:predicted lipid-binding transport protein (Tim44 family)